jgi:glutathione S-transferase
MPSAADPPFRIYGSEMSPYSVKVRSYFRYKGLPHQWLIRNATNQADYQKHAKIPLIPLVVTPDDEGIQDSTPIIERIETKHPDPGIHPDDPVTAFISTLVEEFGDEWGNKWMFHYRWARDVDQLSAAGRIARQMMPRADDVQQAAATTEVRSRMVGRVWFVGSNETTAPQIEASFETAVDLLEAHLNRRPYLFGARPAFGDFGLWAQLYCAWTDPTAGALIEGRAPALLAWIQRMLWPQAVGDFEPWRRLAPTLTPLLSATAGRLFLPWSVANAAAIDNGDESFTVTLDGRTWTQKPQKYHARSLAALRNKYAAVVDKTAVDAALEAAECLAPLQQRNH